MQNLKKYVLIGVAAVVLLVVVVMAAIPMFLRADLFRSRIEATLSRSLNRKVTIGKLSVSVFSGALVAENSTVADDPHFSAQPFIQAASIKIKVEVLPLVLHRQVQIRGFALDSPQIQIIRAANGTWNYSTIGTGGDATKTASGSEASDTFPNLSVDRVEVSNGRLTVSALAGPGAAGSAARVYDQLNLDVQDFSFSKPFTFTAAAHLPGDGSVKIKGNAGPINPQDASLTPFNGNLELAHIDPLAAGFVDAADGVTGSLGSLVLDAAWNGQALHIAKLDVDTPNLTVVRSNKPKMPPAAGAEPEGASMLRTLSVDSAAIKNGTLTLSTAGQAAKPAVYHQLNATLTSVKQGSASPFNASATLPGGGTFAANGNVGPLNFENTAATPLNGQINLKHVQLENSGVIAPDAGIKGLADLQAQIQSNGDVLNATGIAHVEGIQLASNGSPSSRPMDARFTIAQNEKALTGEIKSATINVGKVAVDIGGTYQASGPTTAINLKVNGSAMSIDELVAFLPAVGVRLPQGSQLQGGTVTANLQVSGSTASPVISGPVRLDNTRLAGFDLGSKLATLSKITGGRIGSATGSGTNIRSLSMNVTQSGGATRTDRIALDVAGVGTATGAGSVSAAGALDYNMLLKLTGLVGQPGQTAGAAQAPAAGGLAGLAGRLSGLIPGASGGSGGALASLGGVGGLTSAALKNGIPVAIGGTTGNPTFAPNVAGLAATAGASALQGLATQRLGGKTPAQKPATDQLQNAIGNLFKKR